MGSRSGKTGSSQTDVYRSCLRNIKNDEPVPTEGVAIRASIAQDIATIYLTQVFVNNLSSLIEVEYTFPIPSGAALSSLKIYSGAKVIEAKVEEQEQAREDYADALAQGDDAYMAEIGAQNDIVKLSIGSMKGKAQIRVEVAYVVECKFEGDRWKLVVPLLTFPRYNSAEQSGRSAVKQKWEFVCDLTTASTLRNVRLNLKHSVESAGPNKSLLKATGTDLPNKDIEVSFTTEDISAPISLLQRDSRTGALGLHFSFQTPTTTASLDDFDPSGEFILLLDRSGSMAGASIETAKQAVELFIKSLPEKSLFNIISFGSSHQKLFSESLPYTEENIKTAIKKVKTYTADLGGTNIYTPLNEILVSATNSSFPRYVFVVTDGAVDDVQSIVDMVDLNHEKTRVSTIGIGSGASTDLIERVAKAGQGSSRLILDTNGINQGVLESLEKSLQPTLNDISVEWLAGDLIVQSPSLPFYAFNGDRVSFNAILRESPVAFRVSYTDSLTDTRRTLEFTEEAVTEGSEAVVQAVRGAKDTPDEVRLAVAYQVLTKKTSLIATARNEGSVTDEAPKLIKVSLRQRSSGENPAKARPLLLGRSGGGKKSYGSRMTRGLTFCSASDRQMETKKYRTFKQESAISIECCAAVDRDEDEVIASNLSPQSQIPRSSSILILQNPNGSWTLSSELQCIVTSVCGLSLQDILQQLPSHPADVVTTAFILALLEDKFSHEAELWKLVGNKANRWIKKNADSSVMTQVKQLLTGRCANIKA